MNGDLMPVEKGTLTKDDAGNYFIKKGDGVVPVEKGSLTKDDAGNYFMSQPTAPRAPETVTQDTGMGALGKFAQGATFGFYDELRGAASALTGGDYQSGKEAAIQELEAQSEQSPLTSLASEIAGGMTTAIPLGALGAATKAGKAISTLPSLLRYGLYGAGGGGLAGAGYAEEGDRLEGAGKGAATGAALGAVLPVVGWGAGLTKNPINWAKAAFSSPAKRATTKLSEALRRDALTPGKVTSKLRKMGPEAMIPDAAGENVLGLADAVVQRPGVTRNKALAAVMKRQAGQHGRVMDSLIDTIGDEKNFYKALNDIGESLNTKSAPLYKEAFRANQDMSSKAIDRILKTPAGKKALAGARIRMENKMALMGKADTDLSDQARFLASIDQMDVMPDGVSKGMKLRTMDFIKQEMDDMINSTKRQLATGKARRGEYADLIDLKNKLLKEMDSLDVTASAGPNSVKAEGGAYKRARQVYAGDAKNKQALLDGRNFLKEDAEVTQNMIAKLADSEKEFFKGGSMRAIRDKIESASDSADAYKRIFGNETIRNKIRTIFPDSKTYAKFARQMETESQFYKTRGALTGNSATARRLAGQTDMAIDPEYLSGVVLSPQYATARAGVRLLQNQLGLPEEVADELGKMLFTKDPVTQQKILADVLRKGIPTQSRAASPYLPGATAEIGALTAQ